LIRDGVSVWLAAEGTRSRDGRIGRLKKGGFHLALGTQTPIVPVAIRGTIDILPRGARSMHRGKRVDVTIGAPLPVASRSVDALMSEVRSFLIDHVER
jgi:1-acyl-sn-glycerol-3-phosphate acyltransferase